MTSLQILDRIAFCIGYVVIGMIALGFAVGFCLMVFNWLVILLAGGLRHDKEKRQDD